MATNLKIKRLNKGFQNAASFLGGLTQKSFEKKGFSQAKLITNWYEIVGQELSKQARPLKITFPKNGLGATLLIEIDAAFGPEIELQREVIKEKVNRVYGYTAISKIIFKPSSSLGYNVKIMANLFNTKREKKIVVIENRSVSPDLMNAVLNLKNVKNEELRKSLNDLSQSFIRRSSI